MSDIIHKDMASEPAAMTVGLNSFEELNDDQQPYTMDELNARIDEAEEEIDRGDGKSFEEMMAGFRKELLWLK